MKCTSLPLQRRKFIVLLGGAAVAWPLAVRAQQHAKLPTIGFLGASTPSAQSQWTGAFVQRLRELGWTEGRNIAIDSVKPSAFGVLDILATPAGRPARSP